MAAVMDRLERDLVDLSRRELDSHTLRAEAMERLRDGLGIDGYCFAATDPETLTMTGHATHGVDRSQAPVLYRNEYGQDDFSKHRELATSGRPVRVLSQEAGGDVLRSRRMRDLLAPIGVRHELRAVVQERGTTWGIIHLYRSVDRRDFSADEAALVARVAPHLAAGLRAAATRSAIEAVPAQEAPAMVVLDHADRVVEATPGAAVWLRRVRDVELANQAVPEVLLTLAAWAREQPGTTGRARMAGNDGCWVSVHASLTAGAGRDRVALILQPAAPPELAPLLLRGLGLTKGEIEVCEQVLAGRSTKEIAAELFISPWTVQDRLKAIFAKVGVNSRRELVAKLR